MYRHQLPIPLKNTQTIHSVCSVWDKGYRYGFNTQERDEDIAKGHYTAEYWEYDSRLGRRWNIDPYVRPNFSGYGVLANNPILYVDNNGNDWFLYYEKTFWSWIRREYKIIWVPGNSVIYDPAKYSYSYLGPSLEYKHLEQLGNLRGTYGLGSVYQTLLVYDQVMKSDGVWDKRLEKGYGDFGSYEESKSFPGLHPTVPDKNGIGYGTDMTTVFVANNQVTVQNFYAVVMNSFINGGGPENFYFGKDHAVSQSLVNSKLVQDAIKLFEDGKSDDPNAIKIRSGEFVNINVGESNIVGILNRARSHGTALTPEHLIGSAEVKITLSEDKKSYNISIWNTTSVGSGTLGMDRYKRKNEKDKYTNVSQTIEISVPIDD